MQSDRRPAEGFTPGANNFPKELPASIFKYSTTGVIENEHRTPIRSYGGQSTLYCRECGDYIELSLRIEGQMRGTDAAGHDTLIFVDEIMGACGHIVRSDSH